MNRIWNHFLSLTKTYGRLHEPTKNGSTWSIWLKNTLFYWLSQFPVSFRNCKLYLNSCHFVQFPLIKPSSMVSHQSKLWKSYHSNPNFPKFQTIIWKKNIKTELRCWIDGYLIHGVMVFRWILKDSYLINLGPFAHHLGDGQGAWRPTSPRSTAPHCHSRPGSAFESWWISWYYLVIGGYELYNLNNNLY